MELASIRHSLPYLLGYVVTDREGVVVTKAVDASLEFAPDVSFARIFTLACKEAKRFDMGRTEMVTACYENCVVVHVKLSPLVLTFIADSLINIGALHALVPEFTKALEPLRREVHMDRKQREHEERMSLQQQQQQQQLLLQQQQQQQQEQKQVEAAKVPATQQQRVS